jgi:hypothetical protein
MHSAAASFPSPQTCRIGHPPPLLSPLRRLAALGIIRTGVRRGDAAETAIIELVK